MAQQRQITGLPTTLTQMTGLAKSIALPHDHAPQRYPSFPALERTAVLGFSAPMTWTSTSSNGSDKFMLTRQAGWPFWGTYNTTTPQGFHVDYQLLDYQQTNAPAVTTKRVGPSLTSWSVADRASTTSLPGVVGLTSTMPYPILGVDGAGPPYMYVTGSGWLYFIGATDAPNAVGYNAAIELTIEVWSSPGETRISKVQVTTQPASANYGAFYVRVSPTVLGGTSTGGIWVRPLSIAGNAAHSTSMITAISCFNAATHGFSATSSANPVIALTAGPTTQAFTPIVTPVEFANTPLPWFATRTTAAAALLTNVTQVLNKAGTFLGGRVSPNVIDPFNVTPSYISTLHPAEKNQLAAEEGFYTYAPPSTDLVNFWDYTLNTSNGAPPSPVYRLDNDALVNIIYHTDPQTASYSITVDWHLEFRTSSALFPIAVSSMPIESLHQAQLALTTTGFFFNNWNHEKIRAIVMNIGKYLLSTNPYGRAAMGIYAAGKAIALGRRPKPFTAPTNYLPTAQSKRKSKRGGRRRQRKGPQPPPQRQKEFKPKSGLAMFLKSRGQLK